MVLLLSLLVSQLVAPIKTDLSYSTLITDNQGQVKHAFLNNGDRWIMKIKPGEISKKVRSALLYKEDKYFNWHFGFNPISIARATWQNLISGKRLSGASTITMQVVRLLEPRERTYLSKLIEVFRSMQLELFYSKEEIFNLYLEKAPMGGNIEGLKAGALLYFGKSTNNLSLAEALTLSIIPNRPNTFRIGRNDDLLFETRNHWLKRMLDDKVFSENEVSSALTEPLKAQRREAPKEIPHLARRLKKSYPSEHQITTFIDTELQQQIEALSEAHQNRLKRQKIQNLAVLVTRNSDHAVLAYLGSADFRDNRNAGQVDGITAIRSPGSTLKPLIYGLAFEQIGLTPETKLYDIPLSFANYQPQNYDELFRGKITASYALAHSLNIPAVKLLDKLGIAEVIKVLGESQFQSIQARKDQLGLSLALGGCGASLEQLVGLYRAFANEGIYVEQQLVDIETRSIQDTLISKGSAYLLTEILTQVNRPDLPRTWQNSKNLPLLAWKTGTSYGRKDAWSIGYNDDYTVGVWTGNFNAVGVPELNGAQMAAPLLFQIFNQLSYGVNNDWRELPTDLSMRYVCEETGLLPSAQCPNQVMDFYFRSKSNTGLCEHAKQVYVSLDESQSYCRTCRPQTGFKLVSYPNHEPEFLSYLQQSNLPIKLIPPHFPKCERVMSGEAPIISSPLEGLTYYLEAEQPEVLFKASVQADITKVHWYINDKYFGSSHPAEQLFLRPPAGNLEITCTDDQGRSSQVWIEVKKGVERATGYQ